jgi:hypothetical protein
VYLERRYPGTRGRIDPDAHVSPVTSSREGLYLAAAIATSPSRIEPLALMQNPFYQTYRAAAIMAGAQPRYLRHSGFPRFTLDLDAVDEAALSRTSILYLCSPSNPDGQVIAPHQLRWAIEAARRHNFLVVFDECYAELYDGEPPAGLDTWRYGRLGRWLNLVLHSLSSAPAPRGCARGLPQEPDILRAQRVRLNGTAARSRCSPPRRRCGRRTRTSWRCANACPGARTRPTGCSGGIRDITVRAAASSCGLRSATGWR